jgi:hypothetical protein
VGTARQHREGAGQLFAFFSLSLSRHHVLILGVQTVCWAEIAPSAWILAPSIPPRLVVTGDAGASALFCRDKERIAGLANASII